MIVLVFVVSSVALDSSFASRWPKRDSKGTINIDEPQDGMFEGSADSSLASGNGIDDEDVIGPDQKPEQKPLPPPIQSPNDNEDEFISSGDRPEPTSTTGPVKKHCELHRDEASAHMALGSFVPQCSAEGDYLPTQCHSSTGHCWCVDSGGEEIAGTRVLPGQTKPNCDSKSYARITTISSTPSTTTFKPLVEKTRCEKQREEILSKRLLGAFIPKCTSDGEFEIIQCHGEMGQCWCVDESGKEIGGSRTPEGSKPDCEPEVTEEVYEPVNVIPPEVSGPTNDGEEEIPNKISPDEHDIKNSIDQLPDDGTEVKLPPYDSENNNVPEGSQFQQRDPVRYERGSYLFDHPGLLAAIIGGAVFGLLCAVLLVMFIVYRMRKKDEGSYPLDERKRPPVGYSRAYQREMFA